jgi:NitT/TauT family transport system substrate-binding protein
MKGRAEGDVAPVEETSVPRTVPTLSRRAAIGLAASAALPFGRANAAGAVLKVAYIPILAMAQLYVVIAEGWAAAAGLDLRLTRFSSGPAMVQALASGGYDVAYVGIGPAMIARASGLDLRVVAANGVNQGAVIGVGDFAAGYAAAPSPAEAFAAFRKAAGRPARVATLPKGSVPDTVLRYWLDEIARVAPSDVQILGMGEDRVQQALLAGSADAASALEPILAVVQERVPSARILVDGAHMFPGQPGATLAVREAAIKSNRAAIEALVGLHVRATKLIQADPARAAADTLKVMGEGLISQQTLERAYRSPAMHVIANPHEIAAATEKMGDYQIKIGALARTVPNDELFDMSLYDALPADAR